MGALLERARRALGGGPREESPAEPFEIACACGQLVEGLRQDHRQFLPCPKCGQVLFVLPVSPYPSPRPVGPARRLDVAADLEPESIPTRRRRPLTVRVRIRLRRAKRRTKAALWAMAPPKRWFSPLRLMMMGMLLAVVGTTAATIYLNRRGGLAGDIVALRRQWTAAIENGDFAAARRHLDAATTALGRFASSKTDSREISQLAREVAVYTELLEQPLDQIAADLKHLPSDAAADRVRSLDRTAILIDAYVGSTAQDDGATNGPDVHSQIIIGDDPARVATREFALWRQLHDRLPRRILFAGRIASAAWDDAAGEWLIELAPDSGVLLTSAVCLERFGWPVDEATRAVLEEQRQWTLEAE